MWLTKKKYLLVKIIACSIFTVVATLSFASNNQSVPKEENFICRSELDNDYVKAIQREGDIAKQAIPLLDAIRKIVSKYSGTNKSLVDLMTQEDKDQFNKLNVQFWYLRQLLVVEKQRDMLQASVYSILQANDKLHKLEINYLDSHNTLEGFDSYINNMNITPPELKQAMLSIWNKSTLISALTAQTKQ